MGRYARLTNGLSVAVANAVHAGSFPEEAITAAEQPNRNYRLLIDDDKAYVDYLVEHDGVPFATAVEQAMAITLAAV